MTEIAAALVGGAATFVATLLVQRWILVRKSRAAALMLVRELEFHNERLGLAKMLDQHPEAEYELKFPSPVWSAYGSDLLAAASLRNSEAVLNWYSSMAVLGYVLGRRIQPDGPQTTGPNRERLQEVLTAAHNAAQRLATRGSLRHKGTMELSPSLFGPLSEE
jgi:hypothetical protein